MKISNFLKIIIIIFITGCSDFANKVFLPNSLDKANIKIEKRNLDFSCNKENLKILLENKNADNIYSSFTKTPYFKGLSFIEKSFALSLLEAQRRPDKIGPNSRTQIFISINGDKKYFEYFNNIDNESYPFLYAIDDVYKKLSNKNIFTFIQQLDLYLPENLSIDEDFQDFIKRNKKDILENEGLSKIWTKGDEPITHFETFKRPKLEKIINIYKQSLVQNKKYQINSLPLPFQDHKNFISLECNFDFNSEIDQMDYNIETDLESNGYLAFNEGNNYFLLLTSNTQLKKISTIDKSSFLKMERAKAAIPFCMLTNENLKTDIILSSTQGRAKSQHLKHVIDYEIYNSRSVDSIYDILNFSRHLFLTTPDRILYESKRGRKGQLDFFLSMNFPIYHVESLGNIIGIFNSNNDKLILKDSRSEAKIVCPK